MQHIRTCEKEYLSTCEQVEHGLGGHGAGEMSDAAETLLSLYDSINAIPGSQKPVNEIFGLDTVEYVECLVCNIKTHKNQFVEVRPSFIGPGCMLTLLLMQVQLWASMQCLISHILSRFCHVVTPDLTPAVAVAQKPLKSCLSRATEPGVGVGVSQAGRCSASRSCFRTID